MKLKLAAAVFVVLSSAGCVTSTNSYTRDIVYRDGSYYSPADEQNGDYYYEPEPDYSYYDDYDYGFGYYGNSRYGGNSFSSCRFSYRYDRYCDRGWGSSFLSFGGLSIFFGSPNRYDYGHGYYGNYGYGSNDGYYRGYPNYGGHAPGYAPRNNDPIPMPKPRRPIGQVPDYGFDNGPGMRVPGEPVFIPTKPGRIDQNPVERGAEPQEQENLNPYTRNRPQRPNRPEFPRVDREDNGDGIVIREDNARQRRTRPFFPIREDRPEPIEKPIRDDRRTQPYPQRRDSQPNRQQEGSDGAPEPVIGNNRQERQAPPVQQRERIERPERVERPQRIEAPVREPQRQSSDDSSGIQ